MFVWNCVFCIYVSPKIKLLLLNHLDAISILAFWLGTQCIPFLSKILSATIYYMPMHIAFWVSAPWLICSFWPSYQKCRNNSNCDPNEENCFFPIWFTLEIKQLLCWINVILVFQKQFLYVYHCGLCISKQHRIWKSASGWYIIKMSINSFSAKFH